MTGSISFFLFLISFFLIKPIPTAGEEGQMMQAAMELSMYFSMACISGNDREST